tara:strand:+ start:1310 stop:3049 length:1740 start_codon:yes stop_codon:yes gene_type:complete
MKLMKRAVFATLMSSLALASFANAAAIQDFALLDETGKFHQFSYYGDHQAIVLYAHSMDTPSLEEDLATLNNISDQGGGILVLMMNSQPAESRNAIANRAQERGSSFPVLMDDAQLVASSLGMKHLSETLVINPSTMQVVHRGSVASAERATRELVQNAAAFSAAGEISGALIDYQLPEASLVSYTQDIVPILQDNCVSCHRDGAIAPWSMSSHAMVRGWSPMMKEVVMTRRMPPGQIDTHVGRKIKHVAGLTVEERRKLISWIDAGAPRDGDSDPLASMDLGAPPRFSLGEPDLVVRIPPQEIPATGVIDYRYVPVKLNLDRDVWISGMEFVPGDRKVLHHIIAYLTSPANVAGDGKDRGAGLGENIAGFAPGRQPDQFADNSGRFIPKGSNLLLQMHYTTSGMASVDESEVGLFIHDEPPSYVMSGGSAGQQRFMIPPGAKEHPLAGEMLIERDAVLYQMTPHMHFRGKHMSYTAEYPDGTSELLLSVPKYDFNWQFSYPLEEPLALPAGTRLVATGAMDNSDRNPGNPDPSKPVFFGLQTMHEMFFGFVTLRYEGDTPESMVATRLEPGAAVAGSD